jgi:2-dehydropantoate 2-reductase
MEIAIVGAGVIGSIFGVLFSEKGFDVTLIEVLEERVRLIEREGLWMQWPDRERSHSRISITSKVGGVGKKRPGHGVCQRIPYPIGHRKCVANGG